MAVEQLFRTTKDMLGTRPILHNRDETIRGHVFCSFLTLVLKKDLTDRLAAQNAKLEWADILADRDRVPEVELSRQGKRVVMGTPLTGTAGKVFQAARAALPTGSTMMFPSTRGIISSTCRNSVPPLVGHWAPIRVHGTFSRVGAK